jgi:hypothetical protein
MKFVECFVSDEALHEFLFDIWLHQEIRPWSRG